MGTIWLLSISLMAQQAPFDKARLASQAQSFAEQLPNLIGNGATGLNDFYIRLDTSDAIDERNEDNNEYHFPIFIPGKVPTILYPSNLIGTYS